MPNRPESELGWRKMLLRWETPMPGLEDALRLGAERSPGNLAVAASYFAESNTLTPCEELAPSVLPSAIILHSNLAEKGRHDVGVELRAGAAEHLGNGIFETP